MIVALRPGITGDPGLRSGAGMGGVRLVGVVIQRADHHGPCPGSGIG